MTKPEHPPKTTHDSETPAHGQQVITVCALIHHDFNGVRKAFVAKRAATKKFLPDIYELPGGHVDFGEDLVAGLKREVREEFDMEVSIGDPFAAFTYLNEVKGSHSVEVIYFAAFTEPLEHIQIHPEDHAGYKWVGLDDLEDLDAHNAAVGDIDNEAKFIRRGLNLLSGSQPNFG